MSERVSKSKVKELKQALMGLKQAQILSIRKVKALVAAEELLRQSIEDATAQIDIVGRGILALEAKLAEAEKEPEKPEEKTTAPPVAS